MDTKKSINVTLISLLFATALTATASNDQTVYANGLANPCYTMDVHVTNVTGVSCVLANSGTPTYGYLENGHLPASVIRNGGTTNFHLTQRFGVSFGPDITLSYLCGKKLVTFKSQQSACVGVWAGRTNPTVLYEDTGINLMYQKEDPSRLFSTPGRIRWFIRSSD